MSNHAKRNLVRRAAAPLTADKDTKSRTLHEIVSRRIGSSSSQGACFVACDGGESIKRAYLLRRSQSGSRGRWMPISAGIELVKSETTGAQDNGQKSVTQKRGQQAEFRAYRATKKANKSYMVGGVKLQLRLPEPGYSISHLLRTGLINSLNSNLGVHTKAQKKRRSISSGGSNVFGGVKRNNES